MLLVSVFFMESLVEKDLLKVFSTLKIVETVLYLAIPEVRSYEGFIVFLVDLSKVSMQFQFIIDHHQGSGGASLWPQQIGASKPNALVVPRASKDMLKYGKGLFSG